MNIIASLIFAAAMLFAPRFAPAANGIAMRDPGVCGGCNNWVINCTC